MDYTVPADDSAAKLQDLAGNAAASFSGQQVTNASQAAALFTASVSVVPESHDGSTVFTFELRFSETPRKRFSYKIMRDLAFTVTGGEVTGARRLAPRSNVGWEIHRYDRSGRRTGDHRVARSQRTARRRARSAPRTAGRSPTAWISRSPHRTGRPGQYLPGNTREPPTPEYAK